MLSRRNLLVAGFLVLGLLCIGAHSANERTMIIEPAQESFAKSRWPEVVGMDFAQAKEIIVKEVGGAAFWIA